MPADLGYRPALDGLRAVAITLVLVMHAGYIVVGSPDGGALPGGFVGVDLFFVLSGFLITGLLATERERAGRIAIPDFYRRRALRLLPALFFMLVVYLAYAIWMGDTAQTLRETTLSIVFYVANWAIIDHAAISSGVTHTWSLAIEEQFYFVWPLLLAGLLIALRRRRDALYIVVLAGAVASAIWRLSLSGSVAGWPDLYLRTDTRADALLIGALLGLIIAGGWRPPSWKTGAGGAGALVILGIARLAHREDLWLYRGGLFLVAVAAAALIAACLEVDWWLPQLLAHRAPVLVGQLSYSLYLWHFPVFVAVADHGSDLPTALRVVVAVAITFAMSAISRRFVEEPFLRLKDARKRTMSVDRVR